jgi:DNA-binding GntR family transcriptional regulator
MALRTQSAIYVRLFPVDAASLERTDEQHRAIVEALRARSAEQAEQAMRVHLQFNAEHIERQIAGLPAAGETAAADAAA